MSAWLLNGRATQHKSDLDIVVFILVWLAFFPYVCSLITNVSYPRQQIYFRMVHSPSSNNCKITYVNGFRNLIQKRENSVSRGGIVRVVRKKLWRLNLDWNLEGRL